jgi:hypothetical protein
VPPGGDATVPLYNFWVTETGRPLPEKGPLSVEVKVTGARWTKVEQEPLEPEGAEPKDTDSASADENDADENAADENAADENSAETVETWTLLEALKTLPAAVTVTRSLRRP